MKYPKTVAVACKKYLEHAKRRVGFELGQGDHSGDRFHIGGVRKKHGEKRHEGREDKTWYVQGWWMTEPWLLPIHGTGFPARKAGTE